MDKLYSLTAMQMKDLLEKKEVSSVEITKSVIDRIEKAFWGIWDGLFNDKAFFGSWMPKLNRYID